jgi:hypothetical protein
MKKSSQNYDKGICVRVSSAKETKESPSLQKIVLKAMGRHFIPETKHSNDDYGLFQVNSMILQTRIQDNLFNKVFSPEPGKDALRASSIYKSIDSKMDLNILPTITTKSNIS